MNRYLVAQLAFSQEMAAVNNNLDLPFVSTHLDGNGAAAARGAGQARGTDIDQLHPLQIDSQNY